MTHGSADGFDVAGKLDSERSRPGTAQPEDETPQERIGRRTWVSVCVTVLARTLMRISSSFAGKSFLEYRRRGGTKRSPLPDFYIGAHAAVARHRLLTRDATRYRTYFPKLDLIAAPDQTGG